MSSGQALQHGHHGSGPVQHRGRNIGRSRPHPAHGEQRQSPCNQPAQYRHLHGLHEGLGGYVLPICRPSRRGGLDHHGNSLPGGQHGRQAHPHELQHLSPSMGQGAESQRRRTGRPRPKSDGG